MTDETTIAAAPQPATWIVTVDGQHRYWVDAPDEEQARQRGYAIHCSTPNWSAGKRSAVTECKPAAA